MHNSQAPSYDPGQRDPSLFNSQAPSYDPSRSGEGGARPALQAGAWFGSYLLVSELGRGGMGAVFRARRQGSDSEVALKVLLSTQLTAAQRERFRREGETTASLVHPGIVRIHDAGEVGGAPYLAYELVEGGRSLEDLPGRVDVEQALELMRATAGAVGAAHRAGVIHRDLKPANVLLDPQGRPKVADFGLARAQDQDRLTKTGALMGTPSYMPPEQISAKKDLGPPADVWALGVMLYELVTGELPFHGENLYELAEQIMDALPERPRKLQPRLSADAEAVILKCLEPAPEDRYPDAAALAEDLELAQAGRVTSAASGQRFRYLRPRGKHWIVALAGGLCVLAVMAVGIVWLQGRQREQAARDALVAYGQGELTRAELVAALPGDAEQLPEDLRGVVHLALAAGPAEDAEGWRERLEHARAAEALLPASSEAAYRAGQALLALGEAEEAAAAFARAVESSDDAAYLRALAEAWLAAGEAERALEVLAPRFVEGEEPTAKAWTLRLRAWLAAGRVEQAAGSLRALRAEQPAPWVAIVGAEVERAAGVDPVPALASAAREWPEHAELLGVLAREQAAAGDVVEAAAAVARARVRAVTGLAPWLESLERLSEGGRTGEVSGVGFGDWPARARAGALEWVRRCAQRHDDCARLHGRVGFPRYTTGITGEERGRRAEALLRLLVGEVPASGAAGAWARLRLAERLGPATAEGRALWEEVGAEVPGREWVRLQALASSAPGEALAGLESAGLERVEATLLRAELRLQEGDAEGARALVEEGEPWEWGRGVEVALRANEALGDAEGVARAQEQLARLRGERREEAATLGHRARDLMKDAPRRERGAVFDEALALDPRSGEVRVHRGQNLLKYADPRVGFGEFLEGLVVDVEQLDGDGVRYFWEAGKAYHRVGEHASTLRGVVRHIEQDPRSPDAVVGFISVLIVEYEEGGPEWSERARRELEACLEQDGSAALYWLCLAFLDLRAGRLAAAEWGLAWVEEEVPELGVAELYRALLWGARGGDRDTLMRMIREAKRRGHPRIEADTLQHYPELKFYFEQPGFVSELEGL